MTGIRFLVFAEIASNNWITYFTIKMTYNDTIEDISILMDIFYGETNCLYLHLFMQGIIIRLEIFMIF